MGVAVKKPPWQWMYNSLQWRMLRLRQLKDHPLCQKCLQLGIVKPAKVVHHVEPHRGDWMKFNNSPLESLCKECHDQHTASVERSGKPVKPRIGLDGWPV